MPVHDRQVFRPVRRDDFVPTRHVLGEVGVLAAGVDEKLAVPVHQSQFGQPELVGVEALDVTEDREQRAALPSSR